MRIRRLMAASMAGVMAVSSAIVCQVTASAAETVIYQYNSEDAGKLTSASLTDEAMAAVNSASASVAVTVDGEGDGAYFYLQETTTWDSTQGSNPTVSIAKGDAHWDAFTAASGIKLVMSGYTKVNKITVLVDDTDSYTIFDLATAPNGKSFPTGGENFNISADDLANAGVTSDNISDARLVIKFESTGAGKQLALLASSGDWENQYYWSNSFYAGEMEFPLTGSADGNDLGDKALTTGILLHCKDSVISKIAISVTDSDAAPEDAALPAYDGSPITMTRQAAQTWCPDGTAQAMLPVSLKGVTIGNTTYGDMKKKISNIVFDGFDYIKDTIGGSASDYSYCIYTQWGSGWTWKASGDTDFDSAASWSLSSITEVNDSDVLQVIGIQINIKDTKNLPANVKALKVDETFTINPESVAVESVKITADDGSAVDAVYTYGDTLALKAVVTPADADGADSVAWTSSSPEIAEVADGAVTFKKAGDVTISAEVGGKSDSVTFTISKKSLTTSNTIDVIEVDAKNTLSAQLEAIAAAYVPDFSKGVKLVKGTDYTVSATASADGKTYYVSVNFIGDAADRYELDEPHKSAAVKYYLTGAKLEKNTLNLVAGDTGVKLAVATTPDNVTEKFTTAFESSDPSVASVASDGTVTPVKPGSAVITVTVKDAKGEYTDICNVTVTDKKVAATGITLDAETKSMTAGDKVKLTATVTPEDSTDIVAWKSSDETVATVDENGNVTAKAAGTAKITASIGEFTATCTITVKAKEPDIVPDDKYHPVAPKTMTKIDSVATTVNSDGTKNMFAVFYISDEDAKACDLLAVTIEREDGKVYSDKLYLEYYYDSISYTSGDKTYQGSTDGSKHYIAVKFLNVDPEWGAISIKVEPIIAKG